METSSILSPEAVRSVDVSRREAKSLSDRTRHLACIEHDVESLRRGGSCRTAVCLCGWKGPQRATLELAADDALTHERTASPTRRNELVKRIAANKDWLSKNWHHGKDVRRGCQANIDADERELAKLDAQPGERAADAER